jgi:hypothetical protein
MMQGGYQLHSAMQQFMQHAQQVLMDWQLSKSRHCHTWRSLISRMSLCLTTTQSVTATLTWMSGEPCWLGIVPELNLPAQTASFSQPEAKYDS